MRALHDLQAELRHMLLAGEDTAAIRRAIAAAEAAEAQAVREAAQRETARAAEEAERIRREANDLAAAAAGRVIAAVAALKPPAAP